MQPRNINQTNQDISAPRLSSYKVMFSPANDYEIYGIYCWNEAISAALFRLISITEVVMRNRFHRVISNHMCQSSTIGSPDSNNWYENAQLNLSSKSQGKIKSELMIYSRGNWIPKSRAPSPNDVISKMTFGFWPALLDATLPWGDLLPHILPGHRHSHVQNFWRKQSRQDFLYARLTLTNNMRNRIAHFEPIWKLGDLLEERRHRHNRAPLITHPKPQTPQEAINRLKLIHDRIVELLGWLSPDRKHDYEISYVRDHILWLCSINGIEAYKRNAPGDRISASRFKREIASIVRRGNKASMTKNGAIIGTYYPMTI